MFQWSFNEIGSSACTDRLTVRLYVRAVRSWFAHVDDSINYDTYLYSDNICALRGFRINVASIFASTALPGSSVKWQPGLVEQPYLPRSQRDGNPKFSCVFRCEISHGLLISPSLSARKYVELGSRLARDGYKPFSSKAATDLVVCIVHKIEDCTSLSVVS